MKTIDELNDRWTGKTVRIERKLSFDEMMEWYGYPEDWHPGFKFGGQGRVIGFIQRDGKVWIQIDEGIEWVVDDKTSIFIVSIDGSYIEVDW